MRFKLRCLGLFLAGHCALAQESSIHGEIREHGTGVPLPRVFIQLEGTGYSAFTSSTGRFELFYQLKGEYVLKLEAPDYQVKRMPVTLGKPVLDLGILYMNRDIETERADYFITLGTEELTGEGEITGSAELLQATRDIFLNRAAFDFGQAFFKVRGYDSKYGNVQLNGIPMNKLTDGRPQWNNWGGLNDITRNQEFSFGLQSSPRTFGGVLGSTHIDTSPSSRRPGIRISGSFSNRTYAGRAMATWNSGTRDNGLAYSLSGSRRWAEEGYTQGSLYDAYSLYGALEYTYSARNTLMLTGIFSSTRRGSSAAVTQEVHELGGDRYNPYWGWQNGRIRNSRVRLIREPVVLLNHSHDSGKFRLNTSAAFQFGLQGKSRLGYFNAPNPDPSYYRYLPSYYTNSPVGANFIGASMTRDGFYREPQLNWVKLYQANASESLDGKAAYILYDDTSSDMVLTLNNLANFQASERLHITAGITYQRLLSRNYARINDLLGADFHIDVDPFTDTRNDQNGDLEKGAADIFNYNFNLHARVLDVFAQFRISRDKWNAFLSGSYNSTIYSREGLFQNQRFPEQSFGMGSDIPFRNLGGKAGLTYKINGRHWISAHGALINKAPVLQNVYINPREHSGAVPGLLKEQITSADLNYHARLPFLTGRLSGFYSRFQNTTDVNFFFVESGVGSDFVQEVLTGLDRLHMGLELGLEYEASASVKVSAVASIGKQLYASDPNVALHFVPGSEPGEGRESMDGSMSLGGAAIKGYRLSQGPQEAYSMGITYRDPKYWWAGMTSNYLTVNYAALATIPRTKSFLLDPGTGIPFPEATPENVSRLLKQQPLDESYFLNLIGGKSWLKKKTYISIFASINNVFDAVYRTGGYEQSRNGNYGQWAGDYQGGSPSFGPKYWYGSGRTFFLSLAISF